MGIMDKIKEEASSTMQATFNGVREEAAPVEQQPQYYQQPTTNIPQYVVMQVVLKEKLIGTGSGNLTQLEAVINNQAAKGYRLHTITTAAGGSGGMLGGDRIQATMVFERL